MKRMMTRSSLIACLLCGLCVAITTNADEVVSEAAIGQSAKGSIGNTAEKSPTLSGMQAEIDSNKQMLQELLQQQAELVRELHRNNVILEDMMAEMKSKTTVYDKETLRTILEDIRYHTDRITKE